MQIKTIDRDTCKVLRQEIDDALMAVGQKYGLQISAGAGSFTNTSVTFKVEAAVLNESGFAETKEARELKLYGHLYGFQPDDLGKTFTSGGFQYRITGMSARSHKFPIHAERLDDGRDYKFPTNTVLKALGRPIKAF